nr:hypothetical protein [uncultured Roseovarius sp.]
MQNRVLTLFRQMCPVISDEMEPRGGAGQALYKKIASTAFLLSILVNSVSAQEYICADNAAIGFSWEDETWVQKRFHTKTRIIKKKETTDPIALFCYREIEEAGYSTEVVYSDYSGVAYGCYQNIVIGEKAASVDQCREIYKKESGEMWAVRCNGRSRYDFAPYGEYVEVMTGPIPDPSNRDSLFMVLGVCSKLK